MTGEIFITLTAPVLLWVKMNKVIVFIQLLISCKSCIACATEELLHGIMFFLHMIREVGFVAELFITHFAVVSGTFMDNLFMLLQEGWLHIGLTACCTYIWFHMFMYRQDMSPQVTTSGIPLVTICTHVCLFPIMHLADMVLHVNFLRKIFSADFTFKWSFPLVNSSHMHT